MKRTFFILLLACSIKFSLQAQTDVEKIHQVIDQFIEGTMFNYPDKVLSTFYPQTPMFL